MQELRGKTAVVTGAGSGIGRELAFACAREGLGILLADIDEAGMRETHADEPQPWASVRSILENTR